MGRWVFAYFSGWRLLADFAWTRSYFPELLAHEPYVLAEQSGIHPDEPNVLAYIAGLRWRQQGLANLAIVLADVTVVQSDISIVLTHFTQLQPNLTSGQRARLGYFSKVLAHLTKLLSRVAYVTGILAHIACILSHFTEVCGWRVKQLADLAELQSDKPGVQPDLSGG